MTKIWAKCVRVCDTHELAKNSTVSSKFKSGIQICAQGRLIKQLYYAFSFFSSVRSFFLVSNYFTVSQHASVRVSVHVCVWNLRDNIYTCCAHWCACTNAHTYARARKITAHKLNRSENKSLILLDSFFRIIIIFFRAINSAKNYKFFLLLFPFSSSHSHANVLHTRALTRLTHTRTHTHTRFVR